MKRLWIGLGILAALISLGIGVTGYTHCIQEGISQELAQAREQAGEGSWEACAARVGRAYRLWQQHHDCLAAIVDHEPMEDAEGLFSQLFIYLEIRDPAAFSACCTGLEVLIHAIGEAQSVNWWNLLLRLPVPDLQSPGPTP